MAEQDVTTRFKADISDLKKGITEARRNIRLANSEFKQAASGMKNWETSSNGLTAKLEQLGKTLENQKKILANMKIEYAEICREQGANSAAAQNLAIKINNQQAAINGTEREMEDYESALKDVRKAEEMAAKNGKSVEENLKEIAKAADGAGEDAEKAANGGFTVLKGVLANLAANAITAAVQGLKKLGAEAIDIGKQAVTAYAEYEQLAGGVETLFGAGGQSIEDYARSVGKRVDEVAGDYAKLMTAQDSVIKNANNAYKTAGLSANEYMETVTSFSASLIAALDGDTVAAAGAADRAITDMSDNANKMGTDMESIQNAYQGFAKQNYTMLDNLKLGYGGTKEEMERLLTDAEKLTGEKFDLKNFADITEAIHAVQTEMGITGTTAEEASQTIDGSVDSMKAAWKNMLAGLAAGDEMDMSQLTANLIDSVVTAVKNLIPRVKTVVNTVMEVVPPIVEEYFPKIKDTIATKLKEIAPEIIPYVHDLISSALEGIGDLSPAIKPFTDALGIIIDNLGTILAIAGPLAAGFAGLKAGMAIQSVVQGFQEAQLALALFSKATGGASIAQGILNGQLSIGEAVTALLTGQMTLAEFAGAGLAKAQGVLNAVMAANPIALVVMAIAALVAAFVILWNRSEEFRNFWIKLWDKIKEGCGKAVEGIIKFFKETLPNAFKSLLNWVKANWPSLLLMLINPFAGLFSYFYKNNVKFKEFVDNAIEALKKLPGKAWEVFTTTISKAADFAKNLIQKGKEAGNNLVDSVVENVKALPGKMVEIGKNLTSGIWEGISSGTAWIKGKITAWVGDVVSFIKNLFGIHSPSKVMENEVGKNIALGIIKGVDDEKKNVKKSAEELANLYVSAAKNRASELKKANKLTEKQEIVFWKEIVSHCKKGTKAYSTAAAQLTTARNTLKKDITELTQTYVSGIGKVREQLQNDIAQLQNKYVDTVTSRVSDITKSFGLLNSVSFDEALSKDDLTRNLSEQAYAIEEWDKVLRSLEGRLGKDSGLYSQLQQMDVSSLETLKSINSMTDEELKRYEYLYNRKQTLAQQRAEYEYAGLKDQTEAQVKELEKSATKQMTELKQAYKKGLKQLGVTVGKESGGIGEAISAGIASGLKKGTAELDGTLKSFAKSTLKKLKQEWGIKSPSRVMRDQVGKYLALGIADGIKSNQDAVSKAMESLKQSLVSDVNFDFGAAKSRIVAVGTSGQAAQNGNGQTSTSTYTFNQYNNSPKALSRLEIYRQTHNILNYAKGE